MGNYIVTGNDFVSLPEIDGDRLRIENFTFLYMGAKGLYNVCGNAETPFLQPFLDSSGERAVPEAIESGRTCFWIPEFVSEYACGRLYTTILAPSEGRGFMVRLRYRNTTAAPRKISLGVEGLWADALREINNADEVKAEKIAGRSWFDTPVFMLVRSVPEFAFCFLFDGETRREITLSEEGVFYRYRRNFEVGAGEEAVLDCAFGLGYEGVAAVTSALDMLRHGFDGLLSETERFLRERMYLTGNERADFLLNYNLFFCYYFAAGITLDTEEFVMVTSRSPRYYVSAAYWDRDGLLWAFPAVLEIDAERAKEMLRYAFTRQIKNVGVHSRYIDGTVLEPGFELDELCAPAVALCRYFFKTGDREFVGSEPVAEGIGRILSILEKKKNSDVGLYETFLYPSDDMNEYPYLTYDNALVAYMLRALAEVCCGILPKEEIAALKQRAEKISEAIAAHCVVNERGKKLYAWCVDLKGNYKIYDEPPGSLVLLAYLGACNCLDEAYKNTVERLYAKGYEYSFAGKSFSELGCAHNAHPWVLSYCNSILAERKADETAAEMLKLRMDNYIACESVSEDTGEATSGEAFATCAGLYAYALMQYYKEGS